MTLLVPLAPAAVLGASFVSRRPRPLVARFSPQYRTLALTAATLAGPTVMGGVTLGYSDKLDWQRKAGEVFVRYTERFPPGELGEADIEEQNDYILDVCAAQRSRREGLRFCLVISARRESGDEVIGGYRYDENNLDPEFGRLAIERFDCFGSEAEIGC